MRTLLPLAALLLAVACSEPAPDPEPTSAAREVIVPPPAYPDTRFPDKQWATATPAEVGIDSAVLAASLNFLADRSGPEALSGTLLVRHGRVCRRGDRTAKAHPLGAGTQAFTAALTGMLFADGDLQLESPAADHDPSLAERYPTVTPRHLLTMTSGYAAAAAPRFAPGKAYAYSAAGMNALARVLTRAAGTSLESYAAGQLMYPLGIRDWTWATAGALPDGTPLNPGAEGLRMAAEDHARFALLYLNWGRWGNEAVVPQAWVRAGTVNQVPEELPLAAAADPATDGRGIYGYGWWVIRARDGIAPVNAYYSRGEGHDVCLIVPEWDLLLVRHATGDDPAGQHHELYSEWLKRLAPGVGR